MSQIWVSTFNNSSVWLIKDGVGMPKGIHPNKNRKNKKTHEKQGYILSVHGYLRKRQRSEVARTASRNRLKTLGSGYYFHREYFPTIYQAHNIGRSIKWFPSLGLQKQLKVALFDFSKQKIDRCIDWSAHLSFFLIKMKSAWTRWCSRENKSRHVNLSSPGTSRAAACFSPLSFLKLPRRDDDHGGA